MSNFDTSLWATFYTNANESGGLTIDILDQPGAAGTYYYAARIKQILNGTFYIRNVYWIVTIYDN